jgi:hypothetical protein
MQAVVLQSVGQSVSISWQPKISSTLAVAWGKHWSATGMALLAKSLAVSPTGISQR